MSDIQLAHSLDSKPRTKDVILEENISFQSLFLPNPILSGLTDSGFIKPSPIQIKALPLGRCGFDSIIQSKSGTGKTLVFSIIALETVTLDINSPQILILTPTREIAIQIEEVICKIGKYFESLSIKAFIGGRPLETDKTNCKECHIAVGTPGRIKQLIENGHLPVTKIRLFVLDEADKLLDHSFLNDITAIYNALPDKKQIIMCSATYPNELKDLLSNYMLSPTYINVEVDSPLLLGLKHYIRILSFLPNIVQQTKAKNEELLRILSIIPFTQCLIFSNFQTRAESISYFLNRNEWNSIYISSAQTQTDRLNSLSSLKEFKCKILVSTDLAARGIDAANVDLVINYDIPIDAMTYLHRMGRAGRFGSTGSCINLAFSGKETELVQNILGIIGGHNISIPVLDGTFNIDSDKHEFLVSIVPENIKDFTVKCKQKVIEMKKKIDKNKKNDNNKRADPLKIVNDQEKVLKVVEEKLANTETADILQQLASGTFEMLALESREPNHAVLDNIYKQLAPSPPQASENIISNTQSENIDTESILNQLANETFPDLSNKCSEDKKRKRCSNSPVQENEQLRDEILCKNKALFGVAKTLSDIDTDRNDNEYLAKYLNILKTRESEETHSLFENKQEPFESYIENIFSLAYNSMVIKDAPKWQDLVPEQDKGKKNDAQHETEGEGDEEEEEGNDEFDEDYNFEVERDIQINYNQEMAHERSGNASDYSFMQWVPVEPTPLENVRESVVPKGTFVASPDSSKNIEVYTDTNTINASKTNPYYYSQYSQYFQQLSNNLWQTGTNFDNVQSFDEWFVYNWQHQILSVRNFVQQKIYVEEMNQFQKRYKKE